MHDDLLFLDKRLVIPNHDPLKAEILNACHDAPLAGHFGVQRTIELVSRKYWWPGMTTHIKAYIAGCEPCQRAKTSRTKPAGTLKPLPIPSAPWSSIAMDFITDLPASNSFDSILVVVDRLTKMAHFIPTTKTLNASGLAHLIIRDIVRLHGLPADIVSDRGTLFTSNFWQALTKTLKVETRLSTAFHPQTDGQTERLNQTLEQYLRLYVNDRQNDWAQLLPLAEFAYNNSEQSSSKQTPFFACFGYHPRFSAPLVTMTDVPAVDNHLQNLADAQRAVLDALQKAQRTQAKYYDQHRRATPSYEPGDRVWLLSKNITTTRPNKKLDYKKLGPYAISENVGTHAYRLVVPDSFRAHPVFHVSLLEPYQETHVPRLRAPDAPEPEIPGADYVVEDIIAHRRRRNRNEYLIKWKDFPPEDNTWQPETAVMEFDRDKLLAYKDRRSGGAALIGG